jgi:hypothetical protein
MEKRLNEILSEYNMERNKFTVLTRKNVLNAVLSVDICSAKFDAVNCIPKF